jgi:hypothetical protein
VRSARDKGTLSVAIGHAGAVHDAHKLEQLLRRMLPHVQRVTIAELGAALGVHTGPGALIVALQPYTTPADFAD